MSTNSSITQHIRLRGSKKMGFGISIIYSLSIRTIISTKHLIKSTQAKIIEYHD